MSASDRLEKDQGYRYYFSKKKGYMLTGWRYINKQLFTFQKNKMNLSSEGAGFTGSCKPTIPVKNITV